MRICYTGTEVTSSIANDSYMESVRARMESIMKGGAGPGPKVTSSDETIKEEVDKGIEEKRNTRGTTSMVEFQSVEEERVTNGGVSSEQQECVVTTPLVVSSVGVSNEQRAPNGKRKMDGG